MYVKLERTRETHYVVVLIGCAFEIHINPPVMVHITFDFKD